jgi:hypothetical protein
MKKINNAETTQAACCLQCIETACGADPRGRHILLKMYRILAAERVHGKRPLNILTYTMETTVKHERGKK